MNILRYNNICKQRKRCWYIRVHVSRHSDGFGNGLGLHVYSLAFGIRQLAVTHFIINAFLISCCNYWVLKVRLRAHAIKFIGLISALDTVVVRPIQRH